MTDPPAEGSSGPIDGPLRDLLDDQRRRDAADARRRSHWLGEAAAQEGGLAGILTDLGERACAVAITTQGGHRLRGTVVGVGPDVVELRATLALVALAAIETVRPGPGSAPTVGARPSSSGPSLRDLLTEWAPERPAVVVRTRGGEAVSGQLRAVGGDVLTVWGPVDRSPVHVPLGAVAAIARS